MRLDQECITTLDSDMGNFAAADSCYAERQFLLSKRIARITGQVIWSRRGQLVDGEEGKRKKGKKNMACQLHCFLLAGWH